MGNENPNKIDWYNLSGNENREAIKLLKENPEKINWNKLSSNSYALELLKENPEKINWFYLSLNKNIEVLEIIKKNLYKIDWSNFTKNPIIFDYDYKKMKKQFEVLEDEIIKKALHPKRMLRLMELYGEDEVYNNYF